MKKQIITLFSALILLSACKQNKQPEVITVNNAIDAPKITVVLENITTKVFTIEGMSCAMGCAASIEKKLNRSEGVQKAEVDFESQKATVSYNASQLDETRIKQLIESVGDGKSYKVVTGE